MYQEAHYIKDITGIDLASFLYGVMLSSVIGPDSRGTAKCAHRQEKLLAMFDNIDYDDIKKAFDKLVAEKRVRVQSNGDIVVGEYLKGYKGEPKFAPLKPEGGVELFSRAKETIEDSLDELERVSFRIDVDDRREFMKNLFDRCEKGDSFNIASVGLLFTTLWEIQTGGGVHKNASQTEVNQFLAMCKRYGNKTGLAVFIEAMVNWEEYFSTEPQVSEVCNKYCYSRILSILADMKVNERRNITRI